MTQPAELSPTLVAVLEINEPQADAGPSAAKPGTINPTADPPAQPVTMGETPKPPAQPVAAAAPPKASHDNEPPKALIDFMLQGWRPPTGGLPEAIEHHEAFARRRSALSERFAGDTLIIPAGHLKVRS